MVGFQLYGVSDHAWTELGITAANAPVGGALLGSSEPLVAGGAYKDIDVSSYVTGNGTYSFKLAPVNGNGTRVSLYSGETGTPPELRLLVNSGQNTAPTADDVTLPVAQDVVNAPLTPVVGDVQTPAALTCTITTPAAHGSATVASDCARGTYTRISGYSGADSFVYQVSDGSLTDTGTVSVTIAAAQAPAAEAQSVSTQRDIALQIQLSASDANGDCPLTFALGATPTNGTLSAITNVQCAAGSATADVTYTPNSGYTGDNSFTFTAQPPQLRA